MDQDFRLNVGKRNDRDDYILGLLLTAYIAGVAKVRPSKDFLPPLCQIWDAQLSCL